MVHRDGYLGQSSLYFRAGHGILSHLISSGLTCRSGCKGVDLKCLSALFIKVGKLGDRNFDFNALFVLHFKG